MCRMAPDGAAHNGRRGLLRRLLSGRAWQLRRAHAQFMPTAADVRAVASFVCARAHRASALSRSSGRSRSIVRAAVAAGCYSRWPTDRRGIGAWGSAFPPTRQSFPSSSAALRSWSVRKVGPTDAERPAVRGEPQVRTSSAMPSSGRLSAPLPPGHHPYLVQRDATPKVGQAPRRGALPVGKAGRDGRVPSPLS